LNAGRRCLVFWVIRVVSLLARRSPDFRRRALYFRIESKRQPGGG
jgi:hypothetical protein